ncbi:MAG: hypothetical protein V7K14_22985 [Nostoc sp.]|uniref:hypothetical protein n=1 Tax=Nostoc sp. TaxID=1180 RepID=UPI002FF92685
MSTENSGTEGSDRTPHQHWVIFILNAFTENLGLKPRASSRALHCIMFFYLPQAIAWE